MRARRNFVPSPYDAQTYAISAYAEPVYVYADEVERYSPYYYGAALVPYVPPTLAEIRQQLRESLLGLNREFAARFGLDPRYTLSTNIGLEIAQLTGISFPTAKRLFHGGVDGVVGAIVSFFGAPFVAAVGLGTLFYAWLESFDSSYDRQ